jgi:hypothetical protein
MYCWINFEGINQELLVANGNFNCLHKEQKKAGDEIWVALFIRSINRSMDIILSTTQNH